jgi:hypothetical protein
MKANEVIVFVCTQHRLDLAILPVVCSAFSIALSVLSEAYETKPHRLPKFCWSLTDSLNSCPKTSSRFHSGDEFWYPVALQAWLLILFSSLGCQ